MLSNRLAIIFLLTRRVSCHGVGVTGDLSLEKDTNWKISSCTDCNISHIKDSTHMSYAHSFIPFTPAYKILFNYQIHSLPKTNKVISNISFHSSASKETSHSSQKVSNTMPESTDNVASNQAVSSLLEKLQSRQDIKIQNIPKVKNLLRTIVSGGFTNLQVVFDFDYTMSRVHKNGEKLDCSWGVMENSKLLPASYVKQTNELRAKYLPIEQDASMTAEEKTPYMVEWYTKANLLLSECGAVKRDMFQGMIKASNVELREGTEKMMNELLKNNVPVLVLSAGLGDLVEEILRYYKVYHSNVKVVSNFLAYDTEGNIVGLAGDVIHVFNKNEKSLKPVERTNGHVENVDLIDEIHRRGNVLLMGDSLGDPCMADGIENPSAVLKIGFLNHNITTDQEKIRLNKYMDAYDIVLVDDQTTDVFNMILEAIDGVNIP